MRQVVVLGAGIAGVTTAWFLAAGGAEVTVLEREDEAAEATSRANGGHISTESAAPWTGPRALREFAATRLSPERAVRILRARDPGRWRWFGSALAASRPNAHARAKSAILDLAAASREALEILLAERNLDAGLDTGGVLGIYRSRRAFARARRRIRGTANPRVLTAEEALALEPALAQAAAPIAGAILYPGDATGDCRRFCLELARHAAAAGVHFRYRTGAHAPILKAGRVAGVATDGGDVDADDCVVALGPEAVSFLGSCGLRVPLLPLRGYTLSACMPGAAAVPGRFVDVERRVVFARLGNVFRAAGMADFAGYDRSAPPERRSQLERIAREWYPALADAAVEHWTCLRPMTPDGPPLLGATPIPGLWLNAGLGALGWTLGCGAGRLVADLVLGRTPRPSPGAFALERFRGARLRPAAPSA